MGRIVVVDDDGDICDLIATKLVGVGHDVHVAVDGQSALEACLTIDPDLLVMDVMMPGMTGIEAVSALRSDSQYAGIRALPVILLTARAKPDDIDGGLDAGADRYITKPFSPRELAEIVEDLLDASDVEGQPTSGPASRTG